MQTSDAYCIKFTSANNNANNTNVAIKGNTFWRGANTYPVYYNQQLR